MVRLFTETLAITASLEKSLPSPPLRLWFAVDVEDVDTEYRHVKTLAIPIAAELRDELWGIATSSLLTPTAPALMLYNDTLTKRMSDKTCPSNPHSIVSLRHVGG